MVLIEDKLALGVDAALVILPLVRRVDATGYRPLANLSAFILTAPSTRPC